MKAYSHYLEELQLKVPIVGDKALVDLINGIQVSGDIVNYRTNRGFLGRVLDTLDGSEYQRQILLDRTLLSGQQGFIQLISEICESVRLSWVTLEITQSSLLEARAAIRSQNQALEQIIQKINTKITDIESRVIKLEIAVAAARDFEQIIAAWVAGRTYQDFSWLIQIILLIREVFSSSVAQYELISTDKQYYRQRLVSEILASSRQITQNFFQFTSFLDQASLEMTSNNRRLAAALLETRSIPQQRTLNMPYLFTVGTALELSVIPESTSPSKPAQIAIEICRDQIDSISYTTDKEELITTLVHETANDCMATISRFSKL